MKNKLGFTLIELLVVVLIIGILAAIALPQYRRSVEKAKLAEALTNIKAVEESISIYMLAHGCPSGLVEFKDVADLDLSGGEWSEIDQNSYYTKDFGYYIYLGSGSCGMEVDRINSDGNYVYSLFVDMNSDSTRQCFTQLTEIGQYICEYLTSQGWSYEDEEL